MMRNWKDWIYEVTLNDAFARTGSAKWLSLASSGVD
jgi:hypothetical protein